MRRFFLFVFSLFISGMMFYSCSTDVDLYADYKDITVVYGLLDSSKDTNFIKINKAFLGPGSAFDIALIDDSCNYPNKLDARLIEYKASTGGNNYQQSRVLPLDTITIHNKDLGIFYAPDQLVYYTTAKLNNNTSNHKYRYELQIDRGDTLLTAFTEMVGGYGFNLLVSQLDFTSEYGKIKWQTCPNASVYELVVKFYFTEVGPLNDSVQRCMTWSLGTFPASTLIEESGALSIQYKASQFYPNLASFLGNDTTKKVERLVFEPSLVLSVAAGGEELYNFIAVNGPSSSIAQNIPEYTNVNGGYGVFSSRTLLEKRVKLSNRSFTELLDHENWRFRQAR
ncbi:MAG: hypothetical protein IKM99_09445 [Bacteroidales bacterium]|nr:hypothetical protein [Bacteroidales bacterium]